MQGFINFSVWEFFGFWERPCLTRAAWFYLPWYGIDWRIRVLHGAQSHLIGNYWCCILLLYDTRWVETIFFEVARQIGWKCQDSSPVFRVAPDPCT